MYLAQADDVRLLEGLKYWLGVCRSTQPLDRARTTEAIGAIYHALGKPRPDVLFFPSPLMCVLAWGALRGSLADRLDSPLVRDFHVRYWRGLWGSVRGDVASRLDSDRFMDQLEVRLQVLHQNLALADMVRDQLSEDLQSLPLEEGHGCLTHEILRQLEKLDGEQGLALKVAIEDVRQQLRADCFSWKTASPPSEPLNGNVYRGPWACGYEVMFDLAQHEGEQGTRSQLWVQQGTDCHWWFPYDGVVFASERPCVLTLDERGRLHNEHAAALEYRDGYAVHAWHGVRVRPIADEGPGNVPTREDPGRSALITRVLLARYGHARYLEPSAVRVH